ncbi:MULTISPECIES: peptide chain release factor N(5)-glutamine methyltransferase [unclassified Lebetimonas]|uniref:peptide chain release factor N(5)-glutamine methyltransferase n=1 Tax=unclassified Lebetimonas TaxID=2648158 RepID=UPI000466562B|nr:MULTISPECIES: peptide chain release factor N(5)-glutamine methyltransferase [unclassified Lebetimonas]
MRIKDVIKFPESVYILEKLLNKDKAWLFLNDDLKVPEEFFEIQKKVKNGYPIEYIFEEVYFYGDKFYISEGVLIPRDDTEVVVDRAIEFIKSCQVAKYRVPSTKFKVIDCCSGSGVIAIEIKKHTGAEVIATDINEIAIEIAKKNAKLHNVEIEFKKCDLFNEKADLLIANPPYVENSYPKPNKFEPDEAFYGGSDGLDIIKKLINKAIEFKIPYAIIETGYNQKELLSKFLKEKGIKKYEFFKDLARNIRGVEIILNVDN